MMADQLFLIQDRSTGAESNGINPSPEQTNCSITIIGAHMVVKVAKTVGEEVLPVEVFFPALTAHN